MGRYHDALVDYNRAIENSRGALKGYIGRGNAYDRLGEFDQALQDYDRAQHIDDRYPDVYIERAIALYRHGDYKRALMEINRPSIGANVHFIQAQRGLLSRVGTYK